MKLKRFRSYNCRIQMQMTTMTVVPQEVYRAIVVWKLYYASSAWRGFTSVDDRQHLDGFIRHSVRQGYCASDFDIVGIIDQAEEKLLQLVLTDPDHVYPCCSLIKHITATRCYLRAKRHDRKLVDKNKFSNRLFIYNKHVYSSCR